MPDIHIEEFFGDAAKIVVNLYSVFPRPVSIFVEDICGPDEPDEYGVHSNRHQACFATLVWLGEQGYLSYADTIRSEAVDQAVLSGACFSTLLSILAPADAAQNPAMTIPEPTRDLPESIQHQHRTLIYGLQQALNSKSSTQVSLAFEPLLHLMADVHRWRR